MPRGRKFYKYSLIVVDVASRHKEAEPQTSNFLRPGSGMLSRIIVGQLYLLLYLFSQAEFSLIIKLDVLPCLGSANVNFLSNFSQLPLSNISLFTVLFTADVCFFC